MNLSNTGLSSSFSSVDGIDLDDSVVKSAPTETIQPTKERPKSVSEPNEQLLQVQNSKLAEEYLTGVWAHESSVPEVGALVCRMPLEVEIYRGQPDYLSDEFDNLGDSLQSSASTGGAPASIQRSAEDSAPTNTDMDSTFTPLAVKTAFWYRAAEKLLKTELQSIMDNAGPTGKIDTNSLSHQSAKMLSLYIDHQNRWQEVGLVVEKDIRGYAKIIAINRPMAFKLSKSMGRLVLMGAREESNGKETETLVKFLSAFESECGVYVGGRDGLEAPATLIHGIEGLEGAVEISRGTGIYQGGLDAAIDGVLGGLYKPLDFRFFIGHTGYSGGGLDEAISQGKFQPVACSRPLVLKQCIQLPKPLWHEVLEFCGGELKEISKLEFAKRDDLQ